MTGVVFYFLMPKSDYMLNHLKTEEQNKAWLEVYKTMKQRYFLGFLFGALAAVPFAHSFC
jgi:succinate dehydrogenase/fumarate reductase cytochrome b subunit